jgi:hypothetical protein
MPRPLTTADRLPQIGDGLWLGSRTITVNTEDASEIVRLYAKHVPMTYAWRADGGPVGVETEREELERLRAEVARMKGG